MKQKRELGFGDTKMSGIILLNCASGDIKLTVSVLLLQLHISIWIEINVALRTSFLITKWLCSIRAASNFLIFSYMGKNLGMHLGVKLGPTFH